MDIDELLLPEFDYEAVAKRVQDKQEEAAKVASQIEDDGECTSCKI